MRSQEGANINKSLTTLGKVISALAEVVRVPHIFIYLVCPLLSAFSPYRYRFQLPLQELCVARHAVTSAPLFSLLLSL